MDPCSNLSSLQGQKVLITPNTKPGKEILANLVRAVHGLVRCIPGLSLELGPLIIRLLLSCLKFPQSVSTSEASS